MKPKDFYKVLAEAQPGSSYTIIKRGSDLVLAVSEADPRAARMVNWIVEQWPDLTFGEIEEALEMALWWLRFWGMVEYGERQAAAEQTEPGKDA